MKNPLSPLRKKAASLVLEHPGPVAGLVFMLLFTASNHVYYALQAYVLQSSFWHMIVLGALMGFFGSLPVLELIRGQRQLAQVELVRAVVTTLHHEINNPLTVILGCASLMQGKGNYSEAYVDRIMKSGTRIRDVMAQLADLDTQVVLTSEPGFVGVIDLELSK